MLHNLLPNGDPLYARAKFNEARRFMATASAASKGRLISVLLNALVWVHTNELPPHLRKDWNAINCEVTRRGPVFDEQNGWKLMGAIDNTIQRMRYRTASRLLARIFDLDLQFDAWIVASLSEAKELGEA